jgi:hypothetical protein
VSKRTVALLALMLMASWVLGVTLAVFMICKEGEDASW